MKKIIYLLLFVLAGQINAQQNQLSLEDAVLGYYKGLYPDRMMNLQWLENSDRFMYQKDSNIIIKNTDNKEVKRISKSAFLQTFSDMGRLPYVEAATEDFMMFSGESSKILYHYNTQTKDEIKYPKEADNQDFCVKNKYVAYTLGNNLFVANSTSDEIPVAVFKDKNIVSGQAIARSEFGITKGTFWSPKGNYLAFYQKDESAVDEYPFVDVSVTPAKLNMVKYAMNSRGSEEPAVGVFGIQAHKTVYMKLFDKAGKNHYATNLTWGPNENYIYLAEVNRDQNHMWFNKYDAHTGAFVKTLFEEQNKKWVEPEHTAFFIPNGKNEFIWLSERDGFMNLYKYNTDGKLIKQLTDYKWVVKDVKGFSSNGKYVYITGTGDDPRENQLYKVSTRNGKTKALTTENGTHYIMFNKHNNAYIDIFSNIDTPRKYFLVSKDGKNKNTLLTSKDNTAAYNLPKPELFSIKGEFGDKLYARMFKPANFDPQKKYPVLVYVYGGPHAQMVTNSWMGGAPLWMPWLANQDYIVFTVDGHGSASRGFAFESVIHRHLGKVEMKDQLHGVEYLKSLPYVDADRIAVHGWSFGGFMTTSLMTTYPDVFTTGVAGGPVIDWKWYEIMYGERYMDTQEQNPDGFKETSVLNKIQNLKGKLLTIHGYQDDVVLPQHDIALHREAIKKGVQMDFYLYPAAKHNVRGRDRAHLMRKVLDYIMENNK